jgi:hypothetical protein
MSDSGPPKRSDAACARLLCATYRPPAGSAVEALLAQRAPLLQRAASIGVHTALLFTAGWLVHWLEGPPEAVHEAWEQLSRHGGARAPILLHRSRGSSGLGEPVQIASLQAEQGSDVARRLHSIAREHEERWTAEPLEIWQALSAPCLLAGNGSLGFVGRRQVLALASDDNEAVELVRSVAHAAGTRVAYQRYAGSELQRGDVGGAYADIPGTLTTTIRVQALSRRAMAAGIRLLGLGHVERLVLLVGRERVRARAVLTETARLLRTLDHPPVIHLVSPCDATRELAAGALQALAAAQHVVVEASASASATVSCVLAALARQPAQDSRIHQENVPCSNTPIRQP